MFKKILLVFGLFILSSHSYGEVIKVFEFTESELSNLEEKKVRGAKNKTIFSVLVIIYPLIDLLRVFIIRIMSGKSPFKADQNHLHHKLLIKFKSMIVVDLIIFLFSITMLSIFIL